MALSKSDEIFLSIFKDLEITRDPNTPGEDDLPNYQCNMHGRSVKHREIIKMVKDYQDAIVQALMER